MNVGPRGHAGIERGFVLVGVLMFILILTILGLTLFSLSGFEAQFYTNSLDQKRAFYSATGAIERAKCVLSTTGKLSDAQKIAGVPLDGLMYVVAKQGTDFASADSSDTVQWVNNPNPPKPVWIRSLAVVGGQRSMVEAQFTPHRGPSYYKRMFTLSDPLVGLTVVSLKDQATGLSGPPSVQLYGGLWQNSIVPGWLLASVPPNPIDLSGGIPSPDVLGYFAKYWSRGIETARVVSDVYNLNADAQDPVNHVGFFKSSFANGYDVKPKKVWSLDGETNTQNPSDAQINVRGTCVWMFDQGVRFNRHLVVNGSGDDAHDALVLVALPGKDPLEIGKGIVLNQPLYSARVPVYLVCNGGVENENTEDPNADSDVAYLSVFAAQCTVTGPLGAGHKMVLTHAAGASQDGNSTGLVDRLSRKGYLPNTSGSGDFTPIAGKWREITDSNPIN